MEGRTLVAPGNTATAQEIDARTMDGGGSVQILYYPDTQAVELVVTEADGATLVALVNPGEVAEALAHPYCWVTS